MGGSTTNGVWYCSEGTAASAEVFPSDWWEETDPVGAELEVEAEPEVVAAISRLGMLRPVSHYMVNHMPRYLRLGWDGMRWTGIGWDGVGWDGVGWDGMGWGGVGWNGVEWNGMGWGKVVWVRVVWYSMARYWVG